MMKLSSYLSQNKMTQRSLAEALGISKAYACQLVSGARSPGRDLAVQIERLTKGAVPVSIWSEDAA